MSKYLEMSEFELRKSVADQRGLIWYVDEKESPTGMFQYCENWEEEAMRNQKDFSSLPPLNWENVGFIIESIPEILFCYKRCNNPLSSEWERVYSICGSMLKAAVIIYLESLEPDYD